MCYHICSNRDPCVYLILCLLLNVICIYISKYLIPQRTSVPFLSPVPSQILNFGGEVYGIVGASLSLPCPVIGTPAPVVTWSPGGEVGGKLFNVKAFTC